MSKPKSTWSPQQRRRFQATIRRKKLAAKQHTNGAPADLSTPQAALELLEAQRSVYQAIVGRYTAAINLLKE
jgi:hypothetical protein